MVRRQQARVEALRPAPPWWEVRLSLPHVPDPGSFLLGDLGEALRVPLFPSSVAPGAITVHVLPGHPLTEVLPGTAVDVLGPLGKGFRLPREGQTLDRLLLIAEADYLPLLAPLFDAASSVVLVVEASTHARLPRPAHLPLSLELVLVTLDGSAGYLGPLEGDEPSLEGLERVGSRLSELIRWAEGIGLACDPARYPALAERVRQARMQMPRDFAQALVAVPMPCGVGACDVCRVVTRHGERHACTDGPVFDLMEFYGVDYRG